MLINNKRGDKSITALITWIVIIISVFVILLFYFRLNLGKTTAQEVCHNSVVTRASLIGVTDLAKNAYPLNCKTQYVCITKDGTCEEMTSPTIEKVQTKEEVYNVLANQLQECWWMFGEGKVDYVGKEILANNLYCSICSQVVFDDSVDMFTQTAYVDDPNSKQGDTIPVKYRTVNKLEFYQYLENNNLSDGGTSYWNYLYGSTTPEEIEATLHQTDSNYGFGTIDLDSRYYVMMGIVSKTSPLIVGAAAGVGVIGGIAIGAFTGGLGLIALAGAGVAGGGALIGQIVEGESGQDYLLPTMVEATVDFKNLQCSDVRTLS
jgi:hypothetical protein